MERWNFHPWWRKTRYCRQSRLAGAGQRGEWGPLAIFSWEPRELQVVAPGKETLPAGVQQFPRSDFDTVVALARKLQQARLRGRKPVADWPAPGQSRRLQCLGNVARGLLPVPSSP